MTDAPLTLDPEPWLDVSGLFPQRYAENRNPTWPTKWSPRPEYDEASIHSVLNREVDQ